MKGTVKREVSPSHKEAMAAGRSRGRAVKSYLEALETNKPKRGRKRNPDAMRRRIEVIDAEIANVDPLKRVTMAQERIDLERDLVTLDDKVDMKALEAAFVEVAKDYSTSKGLTYAAWREAGVAPDVLKKAQISRSS